MADDEEDLRSGPLKDRLVHSGWKVRMFAYEELEKLLRAQLEDTSPVFAEHSKNFAKFVTDKNAPAQEKALDAYLAFLDRGSKEVVEKTAPAIYPKIIDSTFGQRAKNKDKGVEALLLSVEVECPVDPLVTALIEGADHKQPKIAAIAVNTLRAAISAFGARLFPLKPILKMLPNLFEKKDKAIREEASALVVELYSWIGKVFVSQIQDLRSAQMKELESSFAAVDAKGVKPQATRLKRSENPAFGGSGLPSAGNSASSTTAKQQEDAPIDPFDFLEPQEILSKIGTAFWEGLESKKWGDRRDQLDELLKLLTAPRLVAGEYGDLTKALKKIVEKDVNAVCVTKAVEAIGRLAESLRNLFGKEAKQCVPVLLEKAKDKNKVISLSLSLSLSPSPSLLVSLISSFSALLFFAFV
jgi:cytoskeleton-associated protein 5